MIKMHRTFQRFVATLLLLSFAAMFGVAYLPDNQQNSAMPMAASHEMTMGMDIHDAAGIPHDCCDHDMSGNSVEDLRCSVDCSYYLASDIYAFGSFPPAFGDGVTASMFLLGKLSFLRPPIA